VSKKLKAASNKGGKKYAPANGRGAVIVVSNLKGGSGKSTIAFNLAVWLAAKGGEPLLVDIDPQKTLSDLVSVRDEIGAEPGVASPSERLNIVAEGRWTLVDCGAAEVARTSAVVPQADIILVPVLPSQADIWATQRFLEILRPQRKADARVALFVNRADPPDKSRETRETLAALKVMAGMCEGAVVLPTMLGRRIAFCRSLSEGLGVFELKAKAKASEEFHAFAKAVMALR